MKVSRLLYLSGVSGGPKIKGYKMSSKEKISIIHDIFFQIISPMLTFR